MFSLRPRLGVCATLVLILVACGEQTETPSAPEASASSSAEAEASESANATASPTSGPSPLTMGDLPAGEYTTNAFEPNLVLTLPEGWHQYFPDEDDEIALGGPGVDLNITRPPEVVDPETRAPVATPESLLQWFTDHPSLDVGEPVEVQIDGRSPCLGKEVSRVKLPEGARLIAVVRDGEARLGDGDRGVPSRRKR